MAHKTLKLGAISIVTHPHSSKNYLKLLTKAEKLDRPFNMRADTWANISFVKKLDKAQKEPGPVSGEFLKYTEIDRNSEWYSIASKDVATEEELKKDQRTSRTPKTKYVPVFFYLLSRQPHFNIRTAV